MTMAAISGDRFVLGLGVSGPQVVEGLQGAAFRQPLGRLGSWPAARARPPMIRPQAAQPAGRRP